MGPALPVIALGASIVGTGLSLSSAAKSRGAAREQAANEKKIAAIENARTKANLMRQGRARVGDINVAAAASGTLDASTIRQGRTAVGTNIAREKRDIEKLSALGATAIERRAQSTISAANEQAAASVISGIESIANNQFIQDLFSSPAPSPEVNVQPQI